MTFPAKALSIMRQMRRSLQRSLSPQPIYIFHHIPKCGGTSLRDALGQWFNIVWDYNSDWGKSFPPPKDLSQLEPNQCLCSHFQLPGNYLHQRYPQALEQARHIRVFTMLRDPLKLNISLYYFERKNGRQLDKTLQQVLQLRTNYIAGVTGFTWGNYRALLDKYFFVGILEQGQRSLDLLADRLGKPRLAFPDVNKSTRDEQAETLPEKFLLDYKQVNALDYAIYDYGLQKFESDQHQAASKSPARSSN